jgi:hypothetical protein
VICLDTNFLIHGLVDGSPEAAQLVRWYQSGEPLIAPMPAWFEFLCGPVTAVQVATIRSFLKTIVSFDEPQAMEAARLFNVEEVPSREVFAVFDGAFDKGEAFADEVNPGEWAVRRCKATHLARRGHRW